MLQRWILILAGLLWLAACVGGSAVLLRYSSTPGEEGAALPQWPGDSRLALNRDRDTLVIAVHPHCPCTRASIVELNDLMLALKGRLGAYVLVMKPREFPVGWENTGLVESARRIPGTRVVIDLDGLEAARFGAKTSGQAVLYDDGGRLLFNGGITEGRGHIGDNAGLQRIVSLVKTGRADKNDSLVFGCPLNAKACPYSKADINPTGSKGDLNDRQSSL
jgi:hypothetical protein